MKVPFQSANKIKTTEFLKYLCVLNVVGASFIPNLCFHGGKGPRKWKGSKSAIEHDFPHRFSELIVLTWRECANGRFCSFLPAHGSGTQELLFFLTFSLTQIAVVTQPFFLSGCERHVCGWEAWLPHVCVWVHSPLHQHPPGPQWPAEKGSSLWCDSDRGEEGVPGPPGCAGGVQWILLAGAGRTDKKWLGRQLAWGGTVVWFVCVVATGGLLTCRQLAE